MKKYIYSVLVVLAFVGACRAAESDELFMSHRCSPLDMLQKCAAASKGVTCFDEETGDTVISLPSGFHTGRCAGAIINHDPVLRVVQNFFIKNHTQVLDLSGSEVTIRSGNPWLQFDRFNNLQILRLAGAAWVGRTLNAHFVNNPDRADVVPLIYQLSNVFPATLTELDLSNTGLNRLYKRVLPCRLEHLDISNNPGLTNDTLVGVWSLEEDDGLGGMEINYQGTGITPARFQEL
jgi:hypothetical protein